MPFRIPVGYQQFSCCAIDPSPDVIRDYISWLEREVAVARAALAASITKNKADTPNTFAAAGGRARAVKLTPEQRKLIACNAASARWKKDRNPADPVDAVPQGE